MKRLFDQKIANKYFDLKGDAKANHRKELFEEMHKHNDEWNEFKTRVY